MRDAVSVLAIPDGLRSLIGVAETTCVSSMDSEAANRPPF